jgi:hypothetical protein
MKAGILETDGRVIHPDTGVPPGAGVSPAVAHVSWHDAFHLWCDPVAKPHGRSEVLLNCDADDLVGAFRFRSATEWFYKAFRKRCGGVG